MQTDEEGKNVYLEDSMTLDQVQDGIHKGSLSIRSSNNQDSSHKKGRIQSNVLNIKQS